MLFAILMATALPLYFGQVEALVGPGSSLCRFTRGVVSRSLFRS